MTKLDIIRKAKSVFMKWGLHGEDEPFSGLLSNTIYMTKLSEWRKKNPVTGYSDWYQQTWDYNRREKLYVEISKQEGLAGIPIDYFGVGVCGGNSFKWWLEHNSHPQSRFFGFGTF